MSIAVYIGVGGKAKKVTKAYIGINSVARQIKKMYIGVNGKARLFYASQKQLKKIQTTTYLTGGRYQGASAEAGTSLIIGGGRTTYNAENKTNETYMITKDLVISQVADMENGVGIISNSGIRGLCGCEFDGNALFTGGYTGSYVGTVKKYTQSGTRSMTDSYNPCIDKAIASNSMYAFFGGGFTTRDQYNYFVHKINVSDTISSATNLSVKRDSILATSIGDNVIFAGGWDGAYVGTVDVYDASATKSTLDTLTAERANGFAQHNSKYAVIGPGNSAATAYALDLFDVSLTRITASLATPFYIGVAVTLDDKVIMQGRNTLNLASLDVEGTIQYKIASVTNYFQQGYHGVAGEYAVLGCGARASQEAVYNNLEFFKYE